MYNERNLPRNLRTRLDSLNLVDRFLFAETMEYPEAYGAMVAILLSADIAFLSRNETEKELRVSPELRSVRLDVVGMDEKRHVYHTEMQKKDTHNLIRRSRYCQAQLDVSLLEPGCIDFNVLNDIVVILVAPFDLFGFGLYRYTFNGTCKEVPELRMEDGATRVFINTHGTNRKDFSQEFLDFMDYINESTDEIAARTDSERIKQIHDYVRRVRASEKTGVKYMQLWEEREWDRREARAEGRNEGRLEGLAEGRKMLIRLICRKLQKGASPEKIAEDLEESLLFIRPVCEAAEECKPDYDSNNVYEKLVSSGFYESMIQS